VSDDQNAVPNLRDNLKDRLVAAGRAIVSMVPFAGGALGEILTAVIPGQRSDRIAIYLARLGQRIEQLEQQSQLEIKASADKIDLIEEGAYQAARALSSERIDQIVEAVSAGLGADEVEVARRKRLLTLLGELDDDEVVLLNAFGRNYANSDDDAWERVKRPDFVHLGSSPEDRARQTLFDAGQEHLMRLGLLRKAYRKPMRRDEEPTFDVNEGDFAHSVEISSLGRLLLAEIGLPVPAEEAC
jgi:hypothetical protein